MTEEGPAAVEVAADEDEDEDGAAEDEGSDVDTSVGGGAACAGVDTLGFVRCRAGGNAGEEIAARDGDASGVREDEAEVSIV